MARRSLLVVLALFICSCAARDRFSTVNTLFLTDVDVSKKLSNLPFDHSAVYIPEETRYSAVYVKPVRIDTLSDANWERSLSAFITSRDDYLAKAREVGEYLREQLIEQLQA